MGSKSAIGIGNGICFKQVRDKGGGSYIDPLVCDSIVGLWKFDQNTNESPTRNIIKNTIKNKGGDLELLNFGYKLNSGYGGYIEDFSLFNLSNRFEYSEISDTKITITAVLDNRTGIYHSVTEENSALYWNTFKIKVSGSTDDVYISYTTAKKNIRLYNGINTVVVPNELSWHSFSASKANTSCNITLEFVPLYEGALVTDGKDDMIVSQKTVQEMGITDEITVVSMIHLVQIPSASSEKAYTNQIRTGQNYLRNYVVNNGKTGIYGYTYKGNNASVINNILGDKNDYTVENKSWNNLAKFSVIGYEDNGTINELDQVACYWTFISNKALTADQINQVISYFNLDKHVKPDIIYDTIRQGITNENHASFNDELTDFSGNGHNMKIYNSAWKLGSGIGKYEADYSTWIKTAGVISTPFGFKITEPTHNYWLLHTSNITVPAHKVKVSRIPEGGEFRYLGVHILKNGINELPKMEEHPSAIGFTLHRGTTQPGDWVGLSVEQIPDYEGALVSDGKDDYGKVEGLPILKDYTVAADYARLAKNISSIGDSPILSKSIAAGNGAFIMNNIDNSGTTMCYSFGTGNSITLEDIQRKIYYQSKYSNQGKGINAGSIEDGTSMWLDTIRDNDARFIESAFYSMLLFPYSLSEFLLERQLKRYKLGTLYPGMIEWRPKVNINVPVVTPPTFSMNNGSDIITNGQYIPEGTEITIRIFTTTDSSVGGINEATAKINGVDIELSPSGNNTYYEGKFIVSSKQKIDITIDEYIRYEDIVQPYPAIINLKQDGKTITWGDKLKVGNDIVFVGSANLLPELYTVSDTRYNGVTLYPNTIIKVEKSMVFDNARTYLKANEPSCILSPNRLRIPNSSYKILGYIPDLTGKGNHGKLNNFAYTEDSGVSVDGSIKFDSIDDHITIPNIIGGKCVMAKVKINSINGVIYDQRRANVLNKSWVQLNPNQIAFKQNAVSTYIDGVLNHNITCSDLQLKTVNITCELEIGDTSGTYQPTIGSTYTVGYTTNINLYEFMLFPDVPNEEEIKELNDVIGIKGGYVESPNYYYDAYGKKNTDTDRNLIADQVSKDVANALEVKNVAYNSESGYTDDNGLLLDGVGDYAVNTVIPAVTDFTVIGKRNIILNHGSGFAIKGGNTPPTVAFIFEYDSDKFYNFGGVNTVEFPDTITVATKSSYNGNPAVSSRAEDSLGLRIGKYRSHYSKLVFYKLMLYTKTIDQLSINMLKNLFERDELIDVTNPIFKKEEL